MTVMIEPGKNIPANPNWHNGNIHRKKFLEDIFWKKVDKTSSVNGCWLWTGSTHPSGYGHAWLGYHISAHRASWIINRGAIPEGLWVLHNCHPAPDNPSCVNPKHLWLGTSIQNNTDRDKKGRTAFGLRNGRRKLVDDAVREIRKAYSKGNTTLALLSEEFGVSAVTIFKVIHREIWSHIV